MPSVTRLSLVFLFLFLAPPEVVTGKGKSPRCRTPQVQGGDTGDGVQCSPVPCQGSVEEARYEDCTKYTCKKLTKKDAIWVQSPAM